MNNKKVLFIGFSAALAGLLFGIDVGVISGALPLIKQTFNISDLMLEFITSSMLIGAAAGALISRWISYQIGRRNSIIISGIIFAVTFLISALAPNALTLLTARFFLGIGLGIASFNTPLYLAEISPKEIRGKITGSYQLMIAIGTLFAFLADTIFSSLNKNGYLSAEMSWRMMLALVIIPAILMSLFITMIPKSPRWLILKGHTKEAEKILKTLGSPSPEKECKEIQASLVFSKINWSLLKNKKFLNIILLGVLLQLIQQFCCKNTLNYYAPALFDKMGFHTLTSQMWLTTLTVGVTSIVFTYISMLLVDKYGRKPLLYISGFLILISSALIAITPSDFHGNLGAVIGVFSIVLYMIGYGIGYGPVIWVVCAEIFPLQGKELGMCFAVLTNWIGNFIVGMITLSIIDKYGINLFFGGLVIVQILSLFAFKIYLPETKNKSLEEIEKELLK